jgi:hypothetical protein
VTKRLHGVSLSVRTATIRGRHPAGNVAAMHSSRTDVQRQPVTQHGRLPSHFLTGLRRIQGCSKPRAQGSTCSRESERRPSRHA